TLTLVTPGAQLSAQLALTFSSSTSTLQDVKARGNLLYTVASGSNTVQKIDLAAAGGPKVVAEANTGTGSNPFNLEALDDDTVLGLHPDLVLAQPAPENRGPVETLARLGIPIEAFALGDLAEIEAAMEQIGTLLGAPERGRALREDLERHRARVRAEHANAPP